jgi:hypothetical protein
LATSTQGQNVRPANTLPNAGPCSDAVTNSLTRPHYMFFSLSSMGSMITVAPWCQSIFVVVDARAPRRKRHGRTNKRSSHKRRPHAATSITDGPRVNNSALDPPTSRAAHVGYLRQCDLIQDQSTKSSPRTTRTKSPVACKGVDSKQCTSASSTAIDRPPSSATTRVVINSVICRTLG